MTRSLMPEAEALAAQLANGPTRAYAAMKKAVAAAESASGLEDYLREEARLQGETGANRAIIAKACSPSSKSGRPASRAHSGRNLFCRRPVLGRDIASRLWLADEAKMEAEQEENEMDGGAAAADLRRFDEACPKQRHRKARKIEIEQNPR